MTSSYPSKLFIQMSGAPGSGKSTTANLLAKRINAITIPHDVIKSALLEDSFVSFDTAAKMAYRTDWALAEALIQQGRSVIIDSVCNYQETLDQGRGLALKYEYEYWYLEIRSDVNDLDLLDERLRTRVPLRAQRTGILARPPDADKGRHIEEDAQMLMKKWIVDPSRPEENRVIVVDAKSSLEGRVDYILQHIRSRAIEEEQISSSTAIANK